MIRSFLYGVGLVHREPFASLATPHAPPLIDQRPFPA
jgi:hypothetical protein